MTLDEVREPDGRLVADELASLDTEDLCKSWLANEFSLKDDSKSARYVRSSSSRVSSLVSRTKQKIIPQAIKLSPA